MSDEPAFLAIGDAHLDPWIWKSQRRVMGDAQCAFTAALKVAIEWHIPVVLAGDVFHHIAPPTDIVQFFRESMDECQRNGIEVWFIQGNHDRRDTPWPSAIHSWPRSLSEATMRDSARLRWQDIGGLRCAGFDYATREVTEQRIAALHQEWPVGPPQVLILHQAVRQALRFAEAWNCDLEWVPPQIPLIVMGDIHATWDEVVRQSPRQEAVYTASTHPRDMSQLASHHCLLVKRDLTWERVELPCRSIRQFRLSANDQIREVTDWIAQCPRGEPLPLAWIRHTQEVAQEVARVRSELEMDERALVAVESYATVSEMDIAVDEVGERPDALDIDTVIGRLIDRATEPAAFAFVSELLQSLDRSVVDVIRSHRSNTLGVPVA